jgi:hypothetical protein
LRSFLDLLGIRKAVEKLLQGRRLSLDQLPFFVGLSEARQLNGGTSDV